MDGSQIGFWSTLGLLGPFSKYLCKVGNFVGGGHHTSLDDDLVAELASVLQVTTFWFTLFPFSFYFYIKF